MVLPTVIFLIFALAHVVVWRLWIERDQAPASQTITSNRYYLYLAVLPTLLLMVFMIQPGFASNWALLVAVQTALLTASALYAVSRIGDNEFLNVAALRGAILLGTLLWLSGGLVQVRLYLAPNPDDGMLDPPAQGLDSFVFLVFPLAAVLALYAIGWLLHRRASQWRARRPWLWGAQQWIEWSLSYKGRWILLGVIAALLMLPLVGSASALTVGPIATPEFAKILCYLVIALVFVDGAWAFEIKPKLPPGPGLWRRNPLVFALAIIAVVAVTSAVRGDFGTLIPVTVAWIAAMSIVASRQHASWRASNGEGVTERDWVIRRFVKATRSNGLLRWVTAGGTILVMIALVAMMTTSSKGLRFEAAVNPWKFPWSTSCPDDGGIAREAGAPANVEVFSGVVSCKLDQADMDRESASQVARGLTIVDGGGLWGRGLADTEARILPVRTSDFVLDSIWSKLGALTVLSLMITMITFGWLLSLIPRPRWTRCPFDSAIVFANLVGVVLVTQAIQVLLAMMAIGVPHSGIVVPFLSRGIQAQAAWLVAFAMVAALVVVLGPSGASIKEVPLAGRRRQRGSGRLRRLRQGIEPVRASWSSPLTYAVGLTCVAVLVGLFAPYHALIGPRGHPSLDLGAKHPGVAGVTASRSPLEVRFTDGAILASGGRSVGWVRRGVSGKWSINDLTGLLSEVRGAGGLIDDELGSANTSAEFRSPLDNLKPTRSKSVSIETTIDPNLQAQLRGLLNDQRDRMDNRPWIPYGAAVIDPTTGGILAAASSPDLGGLGSAGMPPMGPVLGALDWFPEKLPNWLNTRQFSICRATGKCRLFDPSSAPFGQGKTVRAYVPANGNYYLPNAGLNRAARRSYGIGSTMKILDSLAYLTDGGKMTDMLSSPPTLDIGPKSRISNDTYSGSICPGSGGRSLSVAAALAVSCNTTFVKMIVDEERTSWATVRGVAHSLGFKDAGKASEHTPIVQSQVPEAPVGAAALANAALGSGGVAATPIQMASVMATIHADGVRRPPHVVTKVNGKPVSNEKESRALPGPVVSQIQSALRGVVTSPVGSLHEIVVDQESGRVLSDAFGLHGKTGTQVLGQAISTTGPQWIFRDLWIVGYLDSPRGPLAFAIVGETHDAAQGRSDVRETAGRMIEMLGKMR